MALRRNATGRAPIRWDGRPFRVLALDPGGTTGYKYAEWTPEDTDTDILIPDIPGSPPVDIQTVQSFTLDDIVFEGGQIGPHEHHQTLEQLLYDYIQQSFYVPLEIVYESFEFRQHIKKDHAKTKVVLISKEYIGVIKLAHSHHWATSSLYSHTSSAAKDLIDDWKLKVLGLGHNLWVPGNEHENDAARHLFRHMVVTKHIREPITNVWLEQDEED